ncbi:MAG: 2-amino-4-hydroxy-6-hydroxymethyldihydropteridine diphosphokinase [Acidimicrobiia bacterium]|nr:2-amino-4-hydroxy-6-hydroxymethyldihydropteridine diphosphokinase [Acidimicrobiia bacterium]
MPRAAIGLGSNLGDRTRLIQNAVSAIAQCGHSIRMSSLYETDPIGGPDQGPYLNAVVTIETDLPPVTLLERCFEIERSAGRERGDRWGPRTLDLDLLLYGDAAIDEEGLTVPHPRMTERRFVLEPLIEVWPDAVLPDGTRLSTFLGSVADQGVSREASVLTDRVSPAALFLVVAVGALAIWWLGDWLF